MIEYTLIKSKRRTVCIQVRMDGTVLVRAPYFYSRRKADALVEEKKQWIERAKKRVQERAKEDETMDLSGPEPFTEAEISALKKQAKKELPPLVREYASRMGVRYGRVAIRAQKTRWGSCSSKGNLNFNCLLMLLSQDVRNYVIVHELCHRKHMNHSAAFWREVAKYHPDYAKDRKTLRTEGQKLLARLPLKEG